MSIIGSNIIAGASGQATGYNLNNSLRFRSSAIAYLNRTLSTPTNNKIWTLSLWVKRGTLTTTQVLFATASEELRYISDGGASGVVDSFQYNAGAGYGFRTNAIYRDVSAWYHIIVAVDTTQATAANRARIYINGVEASTDGTYNITQNTNTQINSAVAHNIGRRTSGSLYFDGYMTEINFVDGQQLTPSSFGETSLTTGQWIPKKYTGSYGTNGFYLKGRGTDNSGNGNNWTENNFNTSNSALTTYDIMLDVPTLTSATVANYCVNNPVDTSPAGGTNAITISAANLNLAGASSDWAACRATIGVTSGKWYWECTRTGASNLIFGIGLNSTTLVNAYSSTSYGYFSTGDKYSNNVSSAYGASFTSGDVIGVAFDADAGTLTFYKNNTSQGTAYTGLTSGPYFPLNQVYTTGSTASINFGQRPFTYTPPSGFVALNTFNLPDSTIKKGNKYMDVNTWPGTGATNVITNSGSMQPDFVWIKGRSNATYHMLTNAVTGPTKYLYSNDTLAEGTWTDQLTSFNSTGFTLGPDTNSTVNYSGRTFVGWQWQAGQGSTSSNTSGSITSTTSVNATAGFSVITFTAPGSGSFTVGHGLGVAPKFIITKTRSNVDHWLIWHTSLGSSGYLIFTTSASATNSAIYNGLPTSALINYGSYLPANGSTYVSYAWAEIAGFSKFGSYTGNGSADGPFNYLGFRPKFILWKRTSTISSWVIWDTSRSTYNAANSVLFPDTSDAESTNAAYDVDVLSNGFKIRTSNATINGSGSTYIFAAFAENPFKNANAR